ncbi:hypothetical protein HZ994_02145 [Akkermansiaceae bacterium]|nr:hypothetical protein HZ994_02145 [Akkermansiaceae bacterium]
MEPTTDKDQEPESIPYGDDLGSGDPVSPEPIPATAASSRQPWLLQDWIALTVAGVLTGLFVCITWNTYRDWPVVMKEIEMARAKIAEIEGAVQDPAALKGKLEKTLQKANEEIAGLRKAISSLEKERAEHAAKKAALDLERAEKKEGIKAGVKKLENAFSSARSAVKKEHPDVDFDALLKSGGPGEKPPYISIPNRDVLTKRLEWEARRKAYEMVGGYIGDYGADLKAMKVQLKKVEGALELAEFAFEKAQKAIESNAAKLNQSLADKDAVERMLQTSLLEADQTAIRKMQEARKTLGESETIRAVLLFQNLPTVLTLFLVSVSALVRLALLRGFFKQRILIPS